jgi:PIN domain nuclease of toxin-antitoxin system
VIEDPANILLFSASGAWEIVIKYQPGKLTLTSPPADFIKGQRALNAIDPLPIRLDHALQLLQLPFHHRDPFDRIMVVQSRVEGLKILTADPLIARYDVDVIW